MRKVLARGCAIASVVIIPLMALAAPVANATDELSGPAHSASQQSIDNLAQIVDKASPEQLKSARQRAVANGHGTFSTSGDVSVEVPKNAQALVSATKNTDKGPVTISVGIGADQESKGQLATNGTVVYTDSSTSDHTVQPTTDGFRIHTVLKDTTAGTEVVHPVTLPAGAKLVAEQDMPEAGNLPEGATATGAAYIVSEEGKVIGGFASPWAKDANGAEVPTKYEIRGNSLIQVIEHRGANTAYPVVADPYLGFDLIDHATWAKHAEGWTFQVTPTGWARASAGGYLPGVYGWDELYSKYRYQGLNTNLGGMRDQYICHQQFAAFKSTWNLDEWRPDVSYAETINTSCNPGGSRWFD